MGTTSKTNTPNRFFTRVKATWHLVGLGLTIWIWGGLFHIFAYAAHASAYWQFAWAYAGATFFVMTFCLPEDESEGKAYCDSIDSTEGRRKALKHWWGIFLIPLIIPMMILGRTLECFQAWGD